MGKQLVAHVSRHYHVIKAIITKVWVSLKAANTIEIEKDRRFDDDREKYTKRQEHQVTLKIITRFVGQNNRYPSSYGIKLILSPSVPLYWSR